MRKGCPHADIRFFPLYIAAHGTGFGCADDQLAEGGCAVDRGMSYAAEFELIRVKCPGLIEDAQWREAIETGKAQRARNHRLNGIH